jgi:hypothetical protein
VLYVFRDIAARVDFVKIDSLAEELCRCRANVCTSLIDNVNHTAIWSWLIEY